MDALHFGGGDRAVFDGGVANNDAVAQDEVAFAVAGHVEFVGDHHDGDALIVEFLKNPHHLNGSFGIEIAGGFVGKEDLRLIDEAAGDGDALLLAAGELVGHVVGAIGEADNLQAVHGAFANLVGRGFAVAAVEHGEFDVFEGGGAREEVKTLEDEAQLLVAEIGQFVAVESVDVDAVEQVGAFGLPVEAAEHVHEGRLAGATRAHEGDEFTALDVETDAADGMDGHFPGLVDFVDVLDLDDGRHGREAMGRRSAAAARTARRATTAKGAAAAEGVRCAARRRAGRGGGRDRSGHNDGGDDLFALGEAIKDLGGKAV